MEVMSKATALMKAKKKLTNKKISLESEKIEIEVELLVLTDRIKDIEENFDKLVEEEANKILQREIAKAKKREIYKRVEEQYKPDELQSQHISTHKKVKKVNKMKQRVYEAINQLKNTNEKITVRKVADIASVAKNTASKYLRQAKEEGIL